MSEPKETGVAGAKSRTRPVISGNLRPYQIESIGQLHEEGLIQGMLDAMKQRSLEEWTKDLDEEAAIGFNLLWLSHAEPALNSQPPADPLGDLFDLCARRKVEIMLATTCTPDWYETLNLDRELEVVGENIRTIAERYGDHPAFHSWYIPHEVYVCWGKMAEYMEKLYPAVVEMCKKATPGKPVTLSPFFILDRDKIFGDYPYAEPEEFERYWTRLLGMSGFDIIMLQDSGEHFSYVTNEQRRPFFEAMHAACKATGTRMWGNVEVAEYVLPSIEEFVRRYGRMHHSKVKGLPWRAVPLDRLEGKLRLAAEFSERLVSWGYYQFGRPGIGPEAAEWYRQYQHYYKKIMAEQ